MGNSFTAGLNNRFGSNITHVANARSEPVWVCFHTTELQPEAIKAAFKAGKETEASIEGNWKYVTQDGLVKIPPDDFHQKHRNTAWERMTIIGHDGQPLVINYQIPANHSYIIAKSGALKRQAYGCSNLFKDAHGVDHSK
uniref:Uncharacterized protein n=1 Tax=Plectus sambesii TaxID=2011161 RepID=A0A914X1Q6_9BILA